MGGKTAKTGKPEYYPNGFPYWDIEIESVTASSDRIMSPIEAYAAMYSTWAQQYWESQGLGLPRD